jgi:hypothetical protein
MARILRRDRLFAIVTRALALQRRPGAGGKVDRLHLNQITGQLQVEWQARGIHPWDRDTPPQCQAELFCEQTLDDVEAVVVRLFRSLPEIEMMAVRVIEPPPSRNVLVAGRVVRERLSDDPLPTSRRMRLKMLGLRYDIIDGQLQPLKEVEADG